jgi:hypothetical protein
LGEPESAPSGFGPFAGWGGDGQSYSYPAARGRGARQAVFGAAIAQLSESFSRSPAVLSGKVSASASAKAQGANQGAFYRGKAVNADVFTPAIGIGVQLGFTEDGRFYYRQRVGYGAQIGLSVVRASLPSQIDQRMGQGFIAFGPYLEAGASVGVPRTPLALDLTLISARAGVAIPGGAAMQRSQGGGVPYLDVAGPGVSGGTLGGFGVGGSYGGEVLFIGRERF